MIPLEAETIVDIPHTHLLGTEQRIPHGTQVVIIGNVGSEMLCILHNGAIALIGNLALRVIGTMPPQWRAYQINE